MDLKKSKDEAVRLCKLIMLTDDVRSHSITAKDEINNTIKSTIDTLWYTISELSNDIESSFEEYYEENSYQYLLMSKDIFLNIYQNNSLEKIL